MECPHCNKKMILPENSERNMETYRRSCTTITECCGNLVTAWALTTFSAIKYGGGNKKDDWGREPNRESKK